MGRDRANPQALSRPARGTLLTSLADGVARVTLNRPEVRNALSRALIGELTAALAAAEADPAARDKAFCAGADLKGVRPPVTS